MSTHHLEFLLQPASIAVIGASNRPRSVGATVMRNLLAGSFAGPIMPVNPNYEAVAGVVTYPDVAHLPTIPDLAVICTPPRLIPGLIGDLGARGSKAAVVLTAGLSDLQDEDEQERTLQDAMLQAAAPYGLRILGPNCVGLLQPALGLNASFAQAPALPGNIAFVSQSGGLTTAVLGWARARGIGFSYVISLGDCADVGFGDVLEFLSRDDNTSAILLYIESIQAARPFLSAARTTSRHKPVLAVKAGRAPEGAAAAASHTGALAGADAVYDAAMRRAGMLRVFTVEDLFNATETLERARPLRGDRLIIVSNGGGAGILATDALRLNNGRLASLSEATLRKLDAHLPSTWSRQNPVDIIGDAPVERYVKTLRILLAEPQADALLFIHVPTAIVPSTEIAEAIAPLLCQADHTVMSCWLGGDVVAPAQQRFQEAGISTYATPDEAVRGFLHLVQYQHNQDMLRQTTWSEMIALTPEGGRARTHLQAALDAGRELLSEPDAKAILAAYGVPVVDTQVADTPAEAARLASAMGFPVVIKIVSPDITHKADVGGVALDLRTSEAVHEAATAIRTRIRAQQPDARLEGFSVQKMVSREHAFELIIGATTDPLFGPVLLFGQGGAAVEVIRDQAIELPPLNPFLARELIARTRIARLLAGYRNRPAVDQEALCQALVQVSHLITEIPEIVELDINPLLADAHGVMALDARMRVQGRGKAI